MQLHALEYVRVEFEFVRIVSVYEFGLCALFQWMIPGTAIATPKLYEAYY